MNKICCMKGLVFAVIVLLIGASVITSMGGTTIEKQDPTDNETSFMGFNPHGDTLYVGGTGPGNYSSIQAAIDDANNGDTVFVFDDSSPYYENIVVNKSINLIGEDKTNTIIDGEGIGYYVINISSSNVTIREFTLYNTGGQSAFASAIMMGKSYHIMNIIVRDCIFTNNNRGIEFRDISNLTIENCHFHHNSDNSIRGTNVDLIGVFAEYIRITNCTINNNGYTSGSSSRSGGIVIGSWMYYCSNIEIANCDIYDNIGEGIFVRDMKNVTIHHNNVYRNNFAGIELGGNITNLEIHHNNIYDNEYFGIFGGGRFSNATIWGNNILSNGNGLPAVGGIYFQEVPNKGLIIRNNNISENDMYGVLLLYSSGVEVLQNNFFENIWGDASFIQQKFLTKNRWDNNFWDRPRFLPKPILGVILLESLNIHIPWFNFDWHPARHPHEIP